MIKKVIALDWRAMKYYQIRGLLLPITAFIFGVVYSPIVVIPFLVFMGISFSINTFAVEEKGELNNLYLTLPVKRNQIVTGRYVLSLIILFAGIFSGIPIMILSNMISFSRYYIGAEGIFAILTMSILLYSIFNLCMFPTLFMLGYQKGKMWGFYIPVIFFAVIFSGYYAASMVHEGETLTIEFISYVTDHLILFSIGEILLAIILLFVSYMISIRLYSRRNL